MKKRSPTPLETILSIILILAPIFYPKLVDTAQPPECPVPPPAPRPLITPQVLDDEADIRFNQQHPELRGRKLTPNDPEILLNDWRQIRQQVQAKVFDRAD
jgi:hypothetical protein